jgi:hypothetical protein
LRPLLIAVAAIAAIGLSACGGDEAAAPLGLDQRVPSATDASGSKPDPVEKRVTATGPDEFITRLGDQLVNPTDEETNEFKTSMGFVKGVHDTRFFPSEPGAAHDRLDVHVFSLVLQFDSNDGAEKASELLHNDGLRPCPETCATQVREFDVDGIQDASGVRRFATAADIKAAGTDQDRPYDSYAIRFADGDFAYVIELFGPPGEVSEEEAEEIAGKLYDRVKGAPVKG